MLTDLPLELVRRLAYDGRVLDALASTSTDFGDLRSSLFRGRGKLRPLLPYLNRGVLRMSWKYRAGWSLCFHTSPILAGPLLAGPLLVDAFHCTDVVVVSLRFETLVGCNTLLTRLCACVALRTHLRQLHLVRVTVVRNALQSIVDLARTSRILTLLDLTGSAVPDLAPLKEGHGLHKLLLTRIQSNHPMEDLMAGMLDPLSLVHLDCAGAVLQSLQPLGRFASLQTLNLDACQFVFGDDVLPWSAPLPRVTHLNLSYNFVGHGKLSRLFGGVPALREVHLSSTGLTDMTALAHGIVHQRLTTVIANDNRFSGCHNDLFYAVAANENLVELSLDRCALLAGDVTYLAQALLLNNALRFLSLAYNFFTHGGCVPRLFMAIEEHDALRHVSLAGNGISAGASLYLQTPERSVLV